MTPDPQPAPWRLVLAAAGVAVAILAVAPFAIACVTAYRHANLNMLDGVFQTYAALRALTLGQAIGTATQPYLGVLMPVALLPAFLALGATPFASTVAAQLFCAAGTLLTAWLLLGYAGVRDLRLRFFCLAICVSLIGLLLPDLLAPENSLRPLRWALPAFVAVPAVCALGRLVRALDAGRTGDALAWSAGLGGLGGLALLWANDAGLPCLLALAGCLALLALPRRPAAGSGCLAVFIAGAAVAAGLTVTVLSHGHPRDWLVYTFVDLPADQFWYFGPWTRTDRIFVPSDIGLLFSADPLTGCRIAILALCSVLLAFRLARRQGDAAAQAGMLLIGAAGLGAALLPQLGGHLEPDYALGTWLPGVGLPVGLLASHPAARPPRASPAVCLATAVVAIGGLVHLDRGMLAQQAGAWGDPGVFFTPLGANLAPDDAADLQWFVRYGELAAAAGMAPERRIFSEYVSPASIAAGGRPASRYAMIIHALGQHGRDEYLRAFRAAAYPLAVTASPQYSGWANWSLRTSWYLFGALLEHYRPFARTGTQIVWRADPAARTDPVATTCAAQQVTPNRVALTIPPDPAAPAAATLVELRLELALDAPAGRWLLVAHESDSPLSRDSARQAERWRWFPDYGLPPRPTQTIVTEVDGTSATRIELELMPAGGALAVRTCAAALLMPVPTARGLPHLRDVPLEESEGAALDPPGALPLDPTRGPSPP